MEYWVTKNGERHDGPHYTLESAELSRTLCAELSPGAPFRIVTTGDDLEGLLYDAYTALRWYADKHPESAQEADKQMYREIEDALRARGIL